MGDLLYFASNKSHEEEQNDGQGSVGNGGKDVLGKYEPKANELCINEVDRIIRKETSLTRQELNTLLQFQEKAYTDLAGLSYRDEIFHRITPTFSLHPKFWIPFRSQFP